MQIVVFTYNRVDGLHRLIRSLNESWYPVGAVVPLTISVDYAKRKKKKTPEAEAADAAARAAVRHYVRDLQWPHGPLTVRVRESNAGLKNSIMEAWYPMPPFDELCAFFEDDIEVSPFWYEWAVAASVAYLPSLARQFGPSLLGPSAAEAALTTPHAEDQLLGISLYRPIHDELSGKDVNRNPKSATHPEAFLLQQPCSWGAVYFPRAWRRFRDWYGEVAADPAYDPLVHLTNGAEPTSNTWARSSSWKKYLIQHMYTAGLTMVYPNLPDRMGFSTNHLMAGEHPTPRRDLFELPLLQVADARKLWPHRVAVATRKQQRGDQTAAAKEPMGLFFGAAADREAEPVQFVPLPQLDAYDVMYDHSSLAASFARHH
jgi:hypothetical protein